VRVFAQPGDLRRVSAGAAVLGERDARHGEAVRDAAEALGLLVAEAVGVDRVDDDQVEPPADRVRQTLFELEQLLHRHLLG